MQVGALSPLAGLIEGVSDFCVDDGSDEEEDGAIQLPHNASLDVKRRALYSEMGIPKDFSKTRAVSCVVSFVTVVSIVSIVVSIILYAVVLFLILVYINNLLGNGSWQA